MTRPSDDDAARLARQGRITALVIAGTMILWIAANWIGAALGLPGRFAILFDLAALGALVWAFVNIYDMWRKRRNQTGD
ncbi:DUF5337 domain-containing protein [Pseudaestuariivita atlantica]|uniref:DUF5337 domain-containing protein n=1 Tax=Pseudaestuariivita atlantica TaxID=1317121 RepID=A0A0L1JL62_9RHOB|nr:DUF5337 domain-containing protein [Pseudaestuariivita atlantica]KNG92485.1 hypothetical protein ATO11_17935 [Pseudaestuariivita atlantica]